MVQSLSGPYKLVQNANYPFYQYLVAIGIKRVNARIVEIHFNSLPMIFSVSIAILLGLFAFCGNLWLFRWGTI